MLTGGGTGGHITPILAVAHELKKLQPNANLTYVGERGGKFASIVQGNTDIDQTHTVYAGKFRRYHGESFITRMLDVRTFILNVRDLFLFGAGFLQSLILLKRLNPDVIFLKGGFVGVPIGLAAAFWRIPFITHDSDIMPGLANRIVSRWARVHATGMPAEYYPYDKKKTKHVGVLVSADFQPVTQSLQERYKHELQMSTSSPVVLVTGGSLGALKVNEAMTMVAPKLLQDYPNLQIIHQVGKGNERTYGPFTNDRLRVIEFMQDQHRYMGAADVVVTRAGANTLAEFGVQGKACIVIPNPLLTGGHQTKNGAYLANENAAIVLDQTILAKDISILDAAIRSLLDDDRLRMKLATRLQQITITDAAYQLASVLIGSIHK